MESAGWAGSFARFRVVDRDEVLEALRSFVPDAGEAQERAWRESVPFLQRETGRVAELEPRLEDGSAILEYLLLLEERRADVLLLVRGPVLVLELKGKSSPSQADLDQVAGYARDLAAYHRDCAERPVRAILVPTRMRGEPRATREGVWLVGPDRIAELVRHLATPAAAAAPSLEAFLDPDAYRPLPTLVEAARQLFESRTIEPVWRARARTDPAVAYVAAAAREAAERRKRHLVLVTGVPGSGKTLVGLRSAHARPLEELSVSRSRGRPTSPALFLSGNGPLVEVLQYALRGAGGDGRTFVRHIKSYLDRYVPRPALVPPEHVLVFDEAQRAFSAEMVRAKHPKWDEALVASEPELFVRICDRIPEWSAMLGLVGSGQEIHLGEEEGLRQWRAAVERSADPRRWVVHVPPGLHALFEGGPYELRCELSLNLDFALRFHLAEQLHLFVERLLDPAGAGAALVADRLWRPEGNETAGLRLWATRDLDTARAYLRERYEGIAQARFGILASSRDRCLESHGVDNAWLTTKNLRLGPWFMDDPASPGSCCRLERCATEFQVQGLELDMALLAWGSDLRRSDGRWVTNRSRGYRRGGVQPRDPMRLRINAYRVLLTRGRDGVVVYLPETGELDETWEHLLASGFRELTAQPVL